MTDCVSTSQKGREAETLAVEFLTKKGWSILQRNFRSRGAELDVVALDDQMLVFVEVKQRNSASAGYPEEAVDSRKMAKLYEAARYFLKRNPSCASRDCRFDVIAIQGTGLTAQLRHLTNVSG